MNKYKVYQLNKQIGKDYSDISLESLKDIPFDVKRVYYVFDTSTNARRGYHAHKKLKQILICVYGSCVIHLDDGRECTEIALDNPEKALYLENMIWREMYNFSKDAVLLVLASELYDESDYIRDYQQFVTNVIENKK